MKKYWLALHPDVFLWCKGERGLLYHSGMNKSFCFGNKGKVKELTAQLLQPENLYCVEITEADCREKDTAEWLSAVRECEAGKLTDQSAGGRPVSYMPLLNLQKDVDRLRNDPSRSVGEDLLSYLHEAVFYLGGSCEVKTDFYRQVLFPVDSGDVLPCEAVREFLLQAEGSGLHTLHFLGGNLFEYPETDRLTEVLNDYEGKVYFHVLDREFLQNAGSLCFLKRENDRLNVICREAEMLKEVIERCRDIEFPVELTGVVHSLQGYEAMVETARSCGWELMEFQPVYTGDNPDFFEEYVFVTPEDLQSPGLNRRQVFARQALNTHFFGQLTVMPGGSVYGNVNRDSLGKWPASLHQLLYREMEGRGAWRYIREQEPCRQCIYQWLCPSPSNYEWVLGRPDLCRNCNGK